MKKCRYVSLLTSDEPLEEIPLSEYPRPQLKRNSYICLNGKWEFEISKSKDIPTSFTKEIIVPYCVESQLSMVQEEVNKDDYLYYRKELNIPKDFIKDKVILHLDSIDCYSKIYINRKEVYFHKGGYIPFEVDITSNITTDEINELIIQVNDPLDDLYPYGKQKKKRGGMWYTPVSGIWKTIWLESVPLKYIKNIKLDVNVTSLKLSINTNTVNKKIIINTPKKKIIKEFKENIIEIKIDNPILWTPDNPYLYDFELYADDDKIESYFALRQLEVIDYKGFKIFSLNGNPYYFHGLLDQGYFPDGIYTPRSYSEYEKDILRAKELGFNTLRKHIKIEPLYFYYLCDKLGIIVFQDMVNNSKYHYIRDTVLPTIGFKKRKDKKFNVPQKNKDIFLFSMKETVSLLYNSPSICLWTIFNESWGQFNSNAVLNEFIKYDTSRYIDLNSGWFDNGNPIKSEHIYFKNTIITKNDNRPLFLSEFGGYELKFKDHSFNLDKTFGYKHFKSSEDLTNGIHSLYMNSIVPLKKKECLCGSIYTQLTDVEDETNGLITYDRKVVKVDKKKMLDIANKLKY